MPRIKAASIGWADLARSTWNGAMDDDIWSHCAELSYYFILAIFPLLICIVALLNMVFHSSAALEIQLLTVITRVLPFSAAELVLNTLAGISQANPETKLSFGLILACWWASAGMMAMMDALNSAYEVKERRSFLRRSLLAVGLTAGVALLLLAAVWALLAAGPVIGTISYGVKALLVKFILWPLAFFLGLLTFAVIYRFAPDVGEQRHWITPGAVVGLFLWSIFSLLLKIYLHFYDTYSATYGSLGAVIVLLLWFYLSGAAVLFGAELNSALQKAAAQRGYPGAEIEGPKIEGPKIKEKPDGGRQPPAAASGLRSIGDRVA